MDANTKKKLEGIRTLVPRYLFRAWNDTPNGVSKISGGHEGLNTPDMITPLAFMNGCTAKSVYDMSKDEFADMAKAHLTGQSSPETRLSSWAASLSFAVNHIGGCNLGADVNSDATQAKESVYISIVDTKELWDEVQAFYVPSLGFLQPGEMQYPHEYLVHGVIQGSAYKALPIKVFHDAGVTIAANRSPWQSPIYANVNGDNVQRLKRKGVKKARQVGDQYGSDFALPMCLAVLCRKKRDSKLFREGVKELDVVLKGLKDLEIPEKWKEDNAIWSNAKYVEGYGDVEQFCRLMRALLDHSNGQEQPAVNSGEGESEETGKKKSKSKQSAKYVNSAQALAAKRAWAKRRSDRIAKKQGKA